ncbi:helix-turn-helix transcriptional regulator [Mycolicibacillus trivialis]
MSALSDLLNRHIDADEELRGLSNRRIAEKAGVSRGTVDNYRAGKIPDAPREDVLQAFHDLLGIPLAELREAAGVPRGEPEPYKAPPEFNRLSRTQRDALDAFVRSFVGPQGAHHAHSPAPANPSASSGASVAPEGDEDQEEARSPDHGQLRAARRRADAAMKTELKGNRTGDNLQEPG